MSDAAGDNLSASLERLIEKMEKMHESQAAENRRTESTLALLDRLTVMLARMENAKNYEAEIGRKIDLLNQNLERTADFQERLVRGQDGESTFNRAVNGVRLFGLILSTLANSIQVAVDNISMVLGKSPDAASPVSGSDHRAARTQAELAAILQPVSTLVKNLVEEKMKQQGQCSSRDITEPEGPPEKKPL
jgi:hypothetical protein